MVQRCTVMVKLLHPLVKYMYIMPELSSNDFYNLNVSVMGGSLLPQKTKQNVTNLLAQKYTFNKLNDHFW